MDQWVHHDKGALVADACPSNVGPLFGSRHDHQVAVMGKDFQARIAEQRVFLVMCGALGCEYLKGLALMGASTGKDGKIWVTDMDRIKVSNLSHQFLFRQREVCSTRSHCSRVARWGQSATTRSSCRSGPPPRLHFLVSLADRS